MKKNTLRTTAGGIVCVLFLCAGTIRAQQERPWMGRFQENIITLKILRLTQALDLTEEQAAKVYPVFTKVEKEKHAIMMDLNGKFAELRNLVESRNPEDKKMEALVGDIRSLQNTFLEKDRELEKFVENNLSSIQRAKYVLFTVDFYRGLGEKLNRARTMNRPPQKKELPIL